METIHNNNANGAHLGLWETEMCVPLPAELTEILAANYLNIFMPHLIRQERIPKAVRKKVFKTSLN